MDLFPLSSGTDFPYIIDATEKTVEYNAMISLSCWPSFRRWHILLLWRDLHIFPCDDQSKKLNKTRQEMVGKHSNSPAYRLYVMVSDRLLHQKDKPTHLSIESIYLFFCCCCHHRGGTQEHDKSCCHAMGSSCPQKKASSVSEDTHTPHPSLPENLRKIDGEFCWVGNRTRNKKTPLTIILLLSSFIAILLKQ